MDLLDRIGLEHPVVQAGMGGGLAGAQLAGAVSAAGGLGTVGMMAPRRFASELVAARRVARGRPVAANLLVPFIRAAHVEACIAGQAALVVLHGGLGRRWLARLRVARIPVLVTVGTPAQAAQALRAGADGLVVQGSEAGGHLLGVEPIDAALIRVLDVAGAVPVLAAGSVAEPADVRRLLDLGANAAVAGTRFLLTDESRAHREYQRRVLVADRTVDTLLFGIGWPMRHRVVPNAATQRWCAADDRGPMWLRLTGRMTAPFGRFVPLQALGTFAARQRVTVPLFSPAPPLLGMPDSVVDRSALYAGETMHRIADVVPAAEAVRQLLP